jgi:hypothetical protein
MKDRTGWTKKAERWFVIWDGGFYSTEQRSHALYHLRELRNAKNKAKLLHRVKWSRIVRKPKR